MQRLKPEWLLYAAFIAVLALRSWPAFAAFAAFAAYTGGDRFFELRREKIHDADRQNLAAILLQVEDLKKKLNAVHAQVFAKRVQADL